jgi:hypothetical protein
MNELVNLYKQLGFVDYYNLIQSNRKLNKTEFIQNDRLLFGLDFVNVDSFNLIECNDGDFRVDVPVWFGDLKNAINRIIVFGLEPRDTNSSFNIERIENKVYATPFGVDRWNNESTVVRKPQNKYFRVFKDLVNNESNFVLFSDVVKDYMVPSKWNVNRKNDELARNIFFEKAKMSIGFLKKEIELIRPTHIITLGLDSYYFVKSNFKNQNVIKLRHPANGGERLALDHLNSLFNS